MLGHFRKFIFRLVIRKNKNIIKINWILFYFELQTGKKKEVLSDEKQGKNDDKLIHVDEEYKIINEWFNYSLIYLISQDQIININEQSEFSKINPYFKPQYKSIFLIHGILNIFFKGKLNMSNGLIFC